MAIASTCFAATTEIAECYRDHRKSPQYLMYVLCEVQVGIQVSVIGQHTELGSESNDVVIFRGTAH